MKTKAHSKQLTTTERNYAAMALVLAVALMPELAIAGGGNPIENFLSGVINFFNTGVMRSVGIIAILSMGVAAYLGKISWELAMKIGAGLILTFGSAGLVDQFSGYVG